MTYTMPMIQTVRDTVRKMEFNDPTINELVDTNPVDLDKVLARAEYLEGRAAEDSDDAASAHAVVRQIKLYQPPTSSR